MTTVNSDMVIYNQLAQTAYLERLQDNLNVFNQASNGAIRYVNNVIQGDFDQKSFYRVGGGIEHRDVNSTAKVTPKKIGAGEMVGIKTPYKYGPYSSTEEAFKRRARSPEEFAEIIGYDLADALVAGRLQYGLTALKAAITSNPDMIAKGSIATDGRKALTKGMRKFGDKFGRISLWVMNSDTYFDIVDEALTNQVYGESELVIYGGLPGTLGKPVLVTDMVGDNDAFGLQAGALTVTESQAPGFRAYDINDEENLAIGMRAEGTFNLDILGYSWDASKGANPTLALLGADANWQKYATSNKMTAGTLLDLSGTP
ncbi:major capsid protein [Acinetobacter celticus]|uniref:Phage capsid protein n=1 Tax=Acinetobacter celticus TaxID=1891224 RepID=A0A1C3CV52_9GAMM|nr:major capsid protein [Acinetobacter celticus]ODA12611.1 phage capsid protein [Acinetobacter celticus]